MELRCLRKGSVSYGLGADFSLPHCLVGDRVSESNLEPSPAGISDLRAEISWCIVMVRRSGKASRRYRCQLYFVSRFQLFCSLFLFPVQRLQISSTNTAQRFIASHHFLNLFKFSHTVIININISR